MAGDSVVVFSVSLFVSTRNIDTHLLCSLHTVVGANLVVKEFLQPNCTAYLSQRGRVGHERYKVGKGMCYEMQWL